MKNKLILFLLLLSSFISKAQITLQHTIDSVTFSERFYYTDIGNNDFKYVFLDTNINGFHLFNMDMTPYITVNIPAIVGNNTIQNGYIAIYITKTLFDCDSTNIEFVYEAPYSGLVRPFYVFRTDGTVLLQVDSANGPYCFGCYGGSFDERPIKNTSDGTKLFLQYSNAQFGAGLKIYSLCGTLSEVYDFDFSNRQQIVKIYPNPTSQQLNFEITLPDNLNHYELLILNENAQVMKREQISFNGMSISIDVRDYHDGTYFYSLCTNNKVYQSGKFVLTK